MKAQKQEPNNPSLTDYGLANDDSEEYDYLSYTEIKNTIDLIDLYLETNEKVIENKQMPTAFKDFTKNLGDIKRQL